MQRGKYPVKDVEASYKRPAEAGYDNSFKMCMITIGIFLLICIVLLLCTLLFTSSHEPISESHSQPGTDAQTGSRLDYKPPPDQPGPEKDNESHTPRSGPKHKGTTFKNITRATTHKTRTTPQAENEDEHTPVENEQDSETTAMHHRPNPPYPNIPQEGTSTKKYETSEDEETKTEQTFIGAPEVKDTGSESEQEETSTKKYETSEDEETKTEQTFIGAPEVKDTSSESEQEETSTKKYETSEDERTVTDQPAVVGVPEVRVNTSESEQEETSTRKYETSEDEERESKQFSGGGIKYRNNETENIGDNETATTEKGLLITRMKQNYKEGEHDVHYETLANWPLFHYQKNDSESVMYGCYGFVEPKGKVRSTYYIYDSSGYHAVTPKEQSEIILGPLKADNETVASDERDAEQHQRDKRKVKQWNYQYFLYKCGETPPKHQEDITATTGSSNTVDMESPGVQGKEADSTEGLPEPAKASNDLGSDPNPEDGQTSRHEEDSDLPETSGTTSETSGSAEESFSESEQVTLGAPTPNSSGSWDDLTSGHVGGSVETSGFPEKSYSESENVIPRLSTPSSASGNWDELSSGHDGGLVETSVSPESSYSDSEYVIPGKSTPSSASGDWDELTSGHYRESVETSDSPEKSYSRSEKVISGPPTPSSASGNDDELTSDHDRVSVETSDSPEKSYSESEQVIPGPPIPSSASGNDDELTSGHDGGSIETSGSPEESHTERQVTPESPKSSTIPGSGEIPGDELSSDHEEGSGAPEQSRGSAESSSAPETSGLKVTQELSNHSNVSESREDPKSELASTHEAVYGEPQTSGGSAEISSTSEITHIEDQPNTTEPGKPTNEEGDEPAPENLRASGNKDSQDAHPSEPGSIA